LGALMQQGSDIFPRLVTWFLSRSHMRRGNKFHIVCILLCIL
jgi:hypothetical protein